MSGNMTAAERLLALLDHLGIGKAHVATQIPADIASLSTQHAERLGGIVLCTPVRLDPAPFAALAERVLMISGEYGPTFEVCLRAADRLLGVERTVLDRYEALGWSDVGADRSAEIAAAMTGFLQRHPADAPRAATAEGSHAGISYKIEGSGPALLLLPFFLAPSQWAPVIPALARHFTVVTLGGRHLGGIAALEDRASMPTYRAMFRTLIDLIAPKPGEAIADMIRVVRPGGRIGIVVRATDLPQWWNLDLPEPIRRKVTPPPQSVAAKGVADASLYRRMRRAGLEDLTCFPTLVTLDRPEGPIWRYREDHVLSLLDREELTIWRAARDKAEADGLLMMAHPLHAAVGRKPNS